MWTLVARTALVSALVSGLAVVPACASSGTAASRDAQARDEAPGVGEAAGAAPTAAHGDGPADFCCESGRGTTGQSCELVVAVQVQQCMDAGKFELHCAGAFRYDGRTATCEG